MTSVRSLFHAVRASGAAPPFDTLHLQVFYPARPEGSEDERSFGDVPADAARAPFPVVVVLPGVNVAPDAYRWLAIRLASDGVVVVTFSWVGELFGGRTGLTPGIDLDGLRPDTYGTIPTASAIRPILTALDELNGTGLLAGLLDPERVIVGGHSAGGSVALQAADDRFFPEVVGAFAYGAHALASEALGFGPGTMLPLAASCPMLIAGGTRDGVMAASAKRYGEDAAGRADPVERTFEEAVRSDRGDVWVAILEGGNHFAMAHPHDPTAARGFLDAPDDAGADAVRERLGDLVCAFVRTASGIEPGAMAAFSASSGTGFTRLDRR